MALFPIAIDNSMVNVSFTDIVGQQNFIMIQVKRNSNIGDSRDFLLQLVDAYQRPVWLLINSTLIIVAILVCMSSNRSMRLKRIRRNIRIRFKRLLVWTSRLYLSLLDRTDFSVSNFKRSILVGSILIGVSLFSAIAINTLGTQLVFISCHLYESLTELAQTKPGLHMMWTIGGYAYTYFQDSQNKLANLVYRRHIENQLIVDDKSMMATLAKYLDTDDDIIFIEGEYWWQYIRRVACNSLNLFTADQSDKRIEFYETTLDELKQVSYAYVINRKLDFAVKNLVIGR